jgi:hypothetical protein
MSRNAGSAPFAASGPDQIPPSIRAKLSNYQVRWLNKQCNELKYKRGEMLAEVFDEWLVRHSDEIIQTKNLADLVSVALDEFIDRHRDEFLRVDQQA